MSARDQFLCMTFAQMTYRESLRDIEACLRGNRHLYDMGIRGNVTRTNLAYANEHRDWRVYADMANLLIRKARRLYAKEVALAEIDQIVYALDSTTIDLCMSLFPWADFRSTKAGVKMHTLMDLRGSIPVFISITDVSTTSKSPAHFSSPEQSATCVPACASPAQWIERRGCAAIKR
jgi:hypothetical protein